MNFYVLNSDVDSVKKFFSLLPEDKRPRVVNDKVDAAVWDHPSDTDQVIVTDAPRVDADAKQIQIEGRQVDEVLAEMHQDEAPVQSEDPLQTLPEPEPEKPKVEGPRTYAERGFKVGRLL